MAAEDQAPDAISASSNYTAPSVADIDDDPDSPDGNWLAWDGNGNTGVTVTFPTPTPTLTTGAGLQEFRVQIRKDASGGNSADWSLELWENAVSVSVLATGTTTATGGEVVSGTWNASSLGTADGSLVECRLLQTGGGTGAPSGRRAVEVGAIKWVVDYTPATTRRIFVV